MNTYYAVIPAEVRYDKDLPATAKLLYGEIWALCAKEGFCWASNAYFCELYGVTERSVKNWVKALSDKGYICCDVENQPGKGFRRKITLQQELVKKAMKVPVVKEISPSENSCTRVGKKSSRPSEKICTSPKPASPTESKAEGQFFSPNNTYNNTMNNTCSSSGSSIYNNNNNDHDKKTSQEDDGWTEAMACYQDNIRPITGAIELDMLRDMFDTYGKAWMTEAIKEAVGSSRGAPSLRYIEAILQRWKRDGFSPARKKVQIVDAQPKRTAWIPTAEELAEIRRLEAEYEH